MDELPIEALRVFARLHGEEVRQNQITGLWWWRRVDWVIDYYEPTERAALEQLHAEYTKTE